MGVLERIKSAISGSIPVEDDLDMGDSQRVRNLPQSDDPNDAVPETEAQSKADTAESNAESYADTEIENHRSNETHDQPQPPENHGNEDHNVTFAQDGDSQPPENHGNGSHNTNYLDSNDYNPEADTHSRYSDSEARTAVDNSNVSVANADNAGDSDTVGGFEPSDLRVQEAEFLYTVSDNGVVVRFNVSDETSTQLADTSYGGVDKGISAINANNGFIYVSGQDGVMNRFDISAESWENLGTYGSFNNEAATTRDAW